MGAQQRKTGIGGFESLAPAVLLLLLSAFPALAQKHSRLEERSLERKALVEKLAMQATTNKRKAREWAQSKGKPVRFERNGRLYELTELRNGEPVYYVTFNYHAAISTAADKVRNTTPYNLNGDGLTVGVWDEGSVRNTHQEFGTRVSLKDPSTAFGNHGTHVAGTIGASGYSLWKQGMAPSVLIDSYDWDDDIAEMTGVASTAPGQATKLYLSNHSYGFTINESYLFGEYWSRPASVDDVVYDSPYYLPFVSAGNEQEDVIGGFGTVSSYGVAKNVITIGAVKDAVSGTARALGNADMTYFSSWGPVNDGRIKPDIVANGWEVGSAGSSSDDAYFISNGTSMASPNACGSAALLVEYYKELFSGGAMRASTLKGLIIHTADNLGNAGPDYKFGWGLMNTKAAADLLKDYAGGAPLRLTEATVTASQPSDTYAFQWNGVDPIRVTLCWTDPAGAADADAEPDLINDLDLQIAGPGGPFYPYKLNKNIPGNPATANSENNVDNVEQVYIASPSSGMYTITVDYDGSLTGTTQWYSLLVSGNSSDSDFDGMPDSWEQLYFSNPTNGVATADLDGDGLDNLGEYIAGTLPNDTGSVFKVTAFNAPPSNDAPFVLNWSTKPGRVYNVGYSGNLVYYPFSVFADGTNLPYTQNSYTDAVEHAGSAHFYHVEVQLDQ
ncbi:S8 family serine peptidase [Pontiella sulfatireligans]|uniref:Serine protease AprX n=1 Tax=Pontiella sulfatireligans TaxID=2750658 RepID=A0A6C2URC6_9BACT|nr:S8 family serine peptidase [Pontiella sulfatireligans]VGO22503.1 Serine protease AprX [Pontiella sulfatireligans]